jgi:hypothetical protein
MFEAIGSVSQEILEVDPPQREKTKIARTEDKDSTQVVGTKDSR